MTHAERLRTMAEPFAEWEVGGSVRAGADALRAGAEALERQTRLLDFLTRLKARTSLSSPLYEQCQQLVAELEGLKQ